MKWKDFINVDYFQPQTGKIDSSRTGFVADALGDMRALALPDNSVDQIFTAHTVDHFPRWEALEMFADWLRMLKPGGHVIIEVADFNRCVLWLFHPKSAKRTLALNQFYGNQWDGIDYETHRYVWSAREIRKVLEEIGFSITSLTHKTETHLAGRDMRIEAQKPVKG